MTAKKNTGVVVKKSLNHVEISHFEYFKNINQFTANISYFDWETIPETIVIINKKTGNTCHFAYVNRVNNKWYFESIEEFFTGTIVLINDNDK